MFSFMLWLLEPREEPGTHCIGGGWAGQGTVVTGEIPTLSVVQQVTLSTEL
jgi:hypothetical protein